MKFKIGQKVRAIRPCDGDDAFLGRAGVVMTYRSIAYFVSGSFLGYKVAFGGPNQWWCEERWCEEWALAPEFDIHKFLNDYYESR